MGDVGDVVVGDGVEGVVISGRGRGVRKRRVR